MAGNQPYPPTSPWFNKEIPVLARDIAKARELLIRPGEVFMRHT
jgi:peptide/nickel transport system substrate-binding protein